MNASLYLALLQLCLIVTKTGSVEVLIQDYLRFISDVHKLDKPTSAIFLRIANNQSVNQTNFCEEKTSKQKQKHISKKGNSIRREIDVLKGKVLRVSDVLGPNFMVFFFNQVCSALELAGNFKMKHVSRVESAGIWNESSKTWNGAIGELVNDKADIVRYLYERSYKRIKAVDFTATLLKVNVCLFVKKSTTKVLLLRSGYTKPFTIATWCGIILILIATLPLLTFMKRKIEKELHYGSLIPEIFLQIWGIPCQQGLTEFPKRSSLRIFYYTIFFSGLFIFALYSACFLMDIITVDEALPFSSLEEFAKEKSYKLIVVKGSSYYEDIQARQDYPWNQIKQKLLKENELPLNIIEAESMLCQGNVALYVVDIFKSPRNEKHSCPLVKISTEDAVHLSMILQKNSPYTQAINNLVIKLQNFGIFDEIVSKIAVASRIPYSKDVTVKYTAVTVSDISALLAIILGTVFLSLIILRFEKVYFRSYEKKNVARPIILRPLAARRNFSI